MLRLTNMIHGRRNAARLLAMFSLTAIVAVALACGSDDPASSPTPTPTASPTPTPTATPSPTPTVTPTPSPYVDFHPVLGESFKLPVDGVAWLDANGYRMTFKRIVNDSRCPLDVQCIVAGAATIEIAVQHGTGEEEALYQLAIGDPAQEPKSRIIGGFEIEFLELDPYPSGTPGPVEATFVVREA